MSRPITQTATGRRADARPYRKKRVSLEMEKGQLGAGDKRGTGHKVGWMRR